MFILSSNKLHSSIGNFGSALPLHMLIFFGGPRGLSCSGDFPIRHSTPRRTFFKKASLECLGIVCVILYLHRSTVIWVNIHFLNSIYSDNPPPDCFMLKDGVGSRIDLPKSSFLYKNMARALELRLF